MERPNRIRRTLTRNTVALKHWSLRQSRRGSSAPAAVEQVQISWIRHWYGDEPNPGRSGSSPVPGCYGLRRSTGGSSIVSTDTAVSMSTLRSTIAVSTVGTCISTSTVSVPCSVIISRETAASSSTSFPPHAARPRTRSTPVVDRIVLFKIASFARNSTRMPKCTHNRRWPCTWCAVAGEPSSSRSAGGLGRDHSPAHETSTGSGELNRSSSTRDRESSNESRCSRPKSLPSTSSTK
jgi:hypothetical protein